MPNNDFDQYTYQDFLQQADEVNVAQVQHRIKKDADEKIKALASEGKTVECKNNTDGKVIWKHVEIVEDDIFTEILEKEKEYLKNNSPMKEKVTSAKDLFDKLWPVDLDDEYKAFVQIVRDTNIERKKTNIRLISEVSIFVFRLLI